MSIVLDLTAAQKARRAKLTPPAKRIALFTANYNLIPDGVSLTLNRLVSFLEQNGAEVLVFSPTIQRPRIKHVGDLVSVPSVRAPGRPEYRVALGLPRGARTRLTQFKPTLFHIATPDLLGNRALRLARRWGIPVVASYHTHFCSYLRYYGLEEFEGYLWKYLRYFYRRCRQVYVASQSMAAVLRAHEISQELRLWERGVDTSVFDPRFRSMAWRRAAGVPDHSPLITFVGRPVWEKGLRIFAEVIEGLEAMRIPHRSMIVGDGPAGNQLASRLSNTIFTGYLRGQSLARAYASSDIFLFPSDTETFGNVTLEAMASGLPSVCADAPGSSSLVVHDHTGFLAEPAKARSFLEYVLRLATDPVVRLRMGRAARERAAHYDWDATLARIVSYYDEVLNPDLESRSVSPSVVSKLA